MKGLKKIFRSLAESQPDVFNSDWAKSLANVANTLIELNHPKRAAQIAEEALALLKPMQGSSPAVTIPWIAFATRSIAQAELMEGNIESGGLQAKLAINLWEEVHRTRPSHELINALKASNTYVSFLTMSDDRHKLLAYLDKLVIQHRAAMLRGNEVLKKTMREIIKTASDFAGDEALQRIPEEVINYVNSPPRTIGAKVAEIP